MRSHSHVPNYTSQQPARSCTIGPLGRKPEVLEVQQTNDPVSKTLRGSGENMVSPGFLLKTCAWMQPLRCPV
jgi:hypothetical protein